MTPVLDAEKTGLPPAGLPGARPVTPVAIIAAELDALVGSAEVAGTAAWRERLERLRDLAVGLDPYVEACTSAPSAALEALATTTATTVWGEGSTLEPEMLSGHVEGQLLRTLVRATGATAVLEVGTFTGYAALAMAEALPDGGRVVTCEVDPGAADLARAAFDQSVAGDRIEVLVGPADRSLAGLAGQSFDLVFIDADKAGYADYLELVLGGGLLSERGLVCVDNTLMQGHPWTGEHSANGAAIAEFNRAVSEDPRVEQVLVPLRDGVTLLMRAPEES